MTGIDWTALIAHGDMAGLWDGLNMLVSRQMAAPPLHLAQPVGVNPPPSEGCADLTQELLLDLLHKGRFEHYLNNSYTSAQIENELTCDELPGLRALRLLGQVKALCKCCVA